MQNFIFVNREENYLRKTLSELNDKTYCIEHSSFSYLVENFYSSKNSVKEDEDFKIFILGNPIYLSNFHEWWNSISCKELFYNDSVSFEFFNRLNGIAALAMLEKKENRIQFVIDPLGYFPLYIFESEDFTIFTDQLRYIYFLEEGRLDWDLNSIKNYLDNGHFLSGKTWFLNVKKAMPASRYYLDGKLNFLRRETYWSWHCIIKSDLDKEILLEKYIEAFEQLFQQIESADLKIGIALSGGLDSRWTAWNMSKKMKNVKAFTFSVLNSIDLKLARKISKCLNLDFNHYVIDEKRGLYDRLKLFWQSDGMVPIQHFHEGSIHYDLSKQYEIVATGFYGGGIYGNKKELNNRVSYRVAHSKFTFNSTLDLIDEEYFNFSSLDPYISYQKISNSGAIQMYQLSKDFKLFLPFYNMNWLAINYSINEESQINSKFYLEALNKSLPAELLKLPWQRTLIPLKYIRLNVLFVKFKIDSILNRLSTYFGLTKTFINYSLMENEIDQWISNLQCDNKLFQLNSKDIYGKMNYLSVLLWMKMCKENKYNVI